MPGATNDGGSGTPGPNSRLDSWKEIATYLKRGARTVRRWERQEGLPVHRHRHGKQATVYAIASEVDTWLKSRSIRERWQETTSPRASQRSPAPAPDVEQKERPTRPVVIAVLPLRNLSGDPKQARFADGLTEELISEIGHCYPGLLRVIATTSVMQFKQSTKGIGEIGRALGVDYILEGGLRRYGRRIRLTARLITTRDQANIWADAYEIKLPAIFSLQQNLARQVAESLSAQFHLKPSPSRRRAIPHNAAAYDAYIEGCSFYLPTDEDIKKKLEHFYLPIDREPKFARGYAELALIYSGLLYRDYPPVMTYSWIEELAKKALQLDSSVALSHAMLAAFQLFRAWNWRQAEASSRRAIKLNPSDPWARIVRAAYHLVVGEPEKGMEELGQARQIGPQSPDLLFWFAEFAFLARHYDWAIERGQELLRLYPSPGVAHALLGSCYAQKGDRELALNHCEKAREFASDLIAGTARACSTYALSGERETAERLLPELVAAQERQYVRYIFLAQASVALGNHQQTLEWLEKAYEQRDPVLVQVRADPRFDSLSGSPPFQDLVRRIGLPGGPQRLALSQAV